MKLGSSSSSSITSAEIVTPPAQSGFSLIASFSVVIAKGSLRHHVRPQSLHAASEGVGACNAREQSHLLVGQTSGVLEPSPIERAQAARHATRLEAPRRRGMAVESSLVALADRSVDDPDGLGSRQR